VQESSEEILTGGICSWRVARNQIGILLAHFATDYTHIV
jgi:hypothetical protein